MHRTIEAILHPDGVIELLEPVSHTERRRALITILEEMPAPALGTSDATRLDDVLRAAGLLDLAEDIPATYEPLSTQARQALAQQLASAASLAQVINEEREEHF